MNDYDWYESVSQLIEDADKLQEQNRLDDALVVFEQAYGNIPEPKYHTALSMVALSSIGELNFAAGRWDYAFEDFSEAVKCKNGLGNPHIHLRLGQLQFARDNLNRATDELMRAYMAGGQEFFEHEDPKYYQLIKSFIEN